MSTPICDFVRRYAEGQPVRFHMPGHKGCSLLGFEHLDITEIDGADELFTSHGIIAESEKQASKLFDAHTIYSTGGSTLCIQTMLHLTALYAASKRKKIRILSARNAHKSFVNAAALLDIEIQWLYPLAEGSSYVSCPVTPEQVENILNTDKEGFAAVYLTSPDYLGNMQNIHDIAAVCHHRGVLLLVDNAHGAYLKFLPAPCHPMDLGADMCCDSAHKTLGVITGGAYLHIAHTAPEPLIRQAKASMSLFGSSSPSYLILQSLDAANDRMEDFSTQLAALIPQINALKRRLTAYGYQLSGSEPLKLTICPKDFGYTGIELASQLKANSIFPEFYDPDYVVLMLSPMNRKSDLTRLEQVLCQIHRRTPIHILPPALHPPERLMSPRQALLSESEVLPISQCEGRISASAAVSCPPAVPLAICGEQIDVKVLNCMQYYHIVDCAVIKE